MCAKGFVPEATIHLTKKVDQNEPYQMLKDSITYYKKHIYDKDRNKYFLQAGQLLHHLVADSFYHYWEGTPWEFYGKTQCPGQGAIACGYFVSTVLQDAGVPVDRIDLAEIASENMIKKLVLPKSIQHFVPFDLEKFIADIKTKGDALYVIGLDYHTGFISCEKGEVWFIHSSGFVKKEVALYSPTLMYNRYGVTGCISSDTTLLKRWLYNN